MKHFRNLMSQAELDALKRLQTETAAELDALLPAARIYNFDFDRWPIHEY